MAANNWNWVFHTLGWTLAGLGLLLALWALFWDRSRGRKRCPKCWYSMDGAIADKDRGFVCPECGRSSLTVHSLHRTRRRKRWLIATIVLFGTGYSAAAVPAIRDDGWLGAIPSSVLVFITEVGEEAWEPSPIWLWPYGEPKGALPTELIRRARNRELSNWQLSVLINRIYKANPSAGEYLVQTRSHWPAHHPVAAYVQAPWFLFRDDDDMVVRTRIKDSGSSWIETKLGDTNPRTRSDWNVCTTGEPDEAVAIEYELRIGATVHKDQNGRITNIDSSTARRVWSGVARTIRVSGTPNDVMKPVANDLSGIGMARTLSPGLSKDADGNINLSLHHLAGHPSRNNLNWTIGLKIEVLRAGETMATVPLLVSPPRPGMHLNLFSLGRGIELDWLADPPTEGDISAGDWTIRLTSDVSTAVLDYERDSYWEGEIEVAVRKLQDESR